MSAERFVLLEKARQRGLDGHDVVKGFVGVAIALGREIAGTDAGLRFRIDSTMNLVRNHLTKLAGNWTDTKLFEHEIVIRFRVSDVPVTAVQY